MRFVILEHRFAGPRPHFDLLFESDRGDLDGWRVDQPPSPAVMPATLLPPHRRAYLTYEGPVYPDLGYVQRFDEGFFEIRCRSSKLLRAELHGKKTRGLLELEEVNGDELEWRCRLVSWR